MNFYVVLCQAIVFSVIFIQILFIIQVSARNEQSVAVGSWFSNLERKLNDVMHEVIQGAKADQWTKTPSEIKRFSYIVDEDKMFTKPRVPRRIQVITEKSTTSADNIGSDMSDERNIDPEPTLITEENTTHHSHRKKKTTKKERKKRLEKPSRWHRLVQKKVPKKKPKKNTTKKKPKIKIISASEHDDDSVTKGKPVDIVVHIKMAD